ncbi:hypothetical protein IC229_24595 [Spirosoma sp. BT702]|uniref:Uncharacterized protein n=1 Tax=Spirosoma profusum TaxID=2771354 RepID=A0A926Y3Y5_9BACT|nr:hypothetical protein [Spirosoma profusum]MBD2703848.1 hypothetical protein [Spirosoma profusum]
MKKPRGCLFSLVVLVVAILVLGTISFFGGKFIDRFRRPWAYSQTEPLLIGKWRGSYKDPDGVAKSLEMEMFVPETDDKRWENAFRTRRRRSGRPRSRSINSFKGATVVVSPLGREEYEIWGHVHRDDYHQIDMTFEFDEKQILKVNNFYLHHAEQSRWQGDELNVTLLFVYRRPDNSAYSDSADPRYSKRVPVHLTRVEL